MQKGSRFRRDDLGRNPMCAIHVGRLGVPADERNLCQQGWSASPPRAHPSRVAKNRKVVGRGIEQCVAGPRAGAACSELPVKHSLAHAAGDEHSRAGVDRRLFVRTRIEIRRRGEQVISGTVRRFRQ